MKSERKKTHVRNKNTVNEVLSTLEGQSIDVLLASCVHDGEKNYQARMLFGLERRNGKRNKKK